MLIIWTHLEFFYLAKLKACGDNNTNVGKMMIFIFDSLENNVRKGENCACQFFLLFPQYFQKGFFPRVVQTLDCQVKGQVNINTFDSAVYIQYETF